MAASAPHEHRPAEAVPFVGVEVATLSADHLRASLRVTGTVLPSSAPMLTSVLRTHLASGRRYLRVDLAAASVTDPEVIQTLVAARRSVSALGGMLVFDNAGPRVVDAIRRATLYVRADQLTSAS
ncbi:STAS domain-containing protein [uncultured Jatrophihabitans sp.]|uniref:STAS domain-containing protein n=1 Tax=uncultured Jatrophihabitans sp. TaxID=1610747 RepID=UPI0035CB12BB